MLDEPNFTTVLDSRDTNCAACLISSKRSVEVCFRVYLLNVLMMVCHPPVGTPSFDQGVTVEN